MLVALAHKLQYQSILSSGKGKKLYDFVLDHIDDLVAVHRVADLSWEYANPALLQKLGYSSIELYAHSPLELVHPDDMARVVQGLKAGLNSGENRDEFRYLKKDGSFLWLRVAGKVIEFPDEESSLVIIGHDITADKQNKLVESQLKRLESKCEQIDKIYSTIRMVTAAVITAKDEEELLHYACQAIVEGGQYMLAWVGFKQAFGDKIQPVAHAGHNYGYLAKLNIHLDDPRRGWGPTGVAIKSGQPVLSNNIKKDEKFSPWVKDALRRGYKSNLTVPVQVEGTIVGVLSVYGAKIDQFSSEEQQLVQDIAGWLGYGLTSIRHGNGFALSNQ